MIDYILVSDGSSDRLLINPINWLFRKHGLESNGKRIDFGQSGFNPKSISEKIIILKSLYSEIKYIIIHRDAENQSHLLREAEISKELEKAEIQEVNALKIVPIRMSEAWMLIDELAIKKAAGKPSSTKRLKLPAITSLESISNPKDILKKKLLEASELKGRRKAQFDFNEARQRVSDNIEDFSPLLQLSAFQRFEAEVKEIIKQIPNTD